MQLEEAFIRLLGLYARDILVYKPTFRNMSKEGTNKQGEPFFKTLLVDRYALWLSTFRDNIYLHIKDTKEAYATKDKGVVKRISLTVDGLKALESVLPEILDIVDENKEATGDEDGHYPQRAYKKPRGRVGGGEHSEDDDDESCVKRSAKRRRRY